MENNQKSILYLDNTYTFGGAINSLEILVRNLDRTRFKPIVVSGQKQRTLDEKFPNSTCYSIPLKLPWVDNRRYRQLLNLLPFKEGMLVKGVNLGRFLYWNLFVTLPESLRYARIGRQHGVRLVHLNNIIGSQLAGILAAKWLRVPCIAHLRDFEEIHPITRTYAQMVDHHVAISESIRANLRGLGVQEKKISLIYDGIDPQNLPQEDLASDVDGDLFRPGRRRIGLFGRIVEWKGIRDFILAMQKVVEKDPSSLGVIVGDVSDGDQAYYDEMVGLTGSLQLSDHIVFTGFRRDVPRLIAAMDVVVHASKRPEPFGRVLIEAMAMGKPLVATRGGGPLEIVQEGVTGFLVGLANPDEMSRAILTLLVDQNLAMEFGKRGKERVNLMFSGACTTRQVEGVYAELIGGGDVQHRETPAPA